MRLVGFAVLLLARESTRVPSVRICTPSATPHRPSPDRLFRPSRLPAPRLLPRLSPFLAPLPALPPRDRQCRAVAPAATFRLHSSLWPSLSRSTLSRPPLFAVLSRPIPPQRMTKPFVGPALLKSPPVSPSPRTHREPRLGSFREPSSGQQSRRCVIHFLFRRSQLRHHLRLSPPGRGVTARDGWPLSSHCFARGRRSLKPSGLRLHYDVQYLVDGRNPALDGSPGHVSSRRTRCPVGRSHVSTQPLVLTSLPA